MNAKQLCALLPIQVIFCEKAQKALQTASKIFKKNKKLQHNQVILATTKEKEKNFQY